MQKKNPFMWFAYLWRAEFSNGKKITQDPEDLYSKHDNKAEYNPSSFRDFLDYQEEHPNVRLVKFCIFNNDKTYTVSFENPKRPVIYYDENNRYGIPTKHYEWFKCKRDLENVRPIYYRRMEKNLQTQETKILHYVIGFQGNEENGNNFKKELKVV